MKQIIQSLISAITGLLSNLTTTDKSNLVAAINEVKAAGSGGGSDTNFANANLTATGDRNHDFSSHQLNINNSSSFSATSDNINGTADIAVYGGDSYLETYNGDNVAAIGVSLAASDCGAYLNTEIGTTGASRYSQKLSVTSKGGFNFYGTFAGVGLTIISIMDLPVYDTEASAVTGGLSVNQVYKTSTGELRIKL